MFIYLKKAQERIEKETNMLDEESKEIKIEPKRERKQEQMNKVK